MNCLAIVLCTALIARECLAQAPTRKFGSPYPGILQADPSVQREAIFKLSAEAPQAPGLPCMPVPIRVTLENISGRTVDCTFGSDLLEIDVAHAEKKFRWKPLRQTSNPQGLVRRKLAPDASLSVAFEIYSARAATAIGFALAGRALTHRDVDFVIKARAQRLTEDLHKPKHLGPLKPEP